MKKSSKTDGTPPKPAIKWSRPKLGGGKVKGSNEDRARPSGMGKKGPKRGNP